MRAWFFWERKLNMSKYTDSYKVRKVKRREDMGKCVKHECGRATNATFEMPPQKVGERKSPRPLSRTFP